MANSRQMAAEVFLPIVSVILLLILCPSSLENQLYSKIGKWEILGTEDKITMKLVLLVLFLYGQKEDSLLRDLHLPT